MTKRTLTKEEMHSGFDKVYGPELKRLALEETCRWCKGTKRYIPLCGPPEECRECRVEPEKEPNVWYLFYDWDTACLTDESDRIPDGHYILEHRSGTIETVVHLADKPPMTDDFFRRMLALELTRRFIDDGIKRKGIEIMYLTRLESSS